MRNICAALILAKYVHAPYTNSKMNVLECPRSAVVCFVMFLVRGVCVRARRGCTAAVCVGAGLLRVPKRASLSACVEDCICSALALFQARIIRAPP